MRAKEFLMKDAYSFDVNDEAAQVRYQKMYDAYVRIFQRCGLQALAVEADTGVMGGKFSHEFMVPAETGENEVVYCETGDYAANIEKAASRGPLVPTSKAAPEETATHHHPQKFPTPGVVTIEALTQAPYKVAAEQQIKTLVYRVENKPALILVRGDDQLNEAKLIGVLGTANFQAATEEKRFSRIWGRIREAWARFT
jgi:prolyl-tRNA synthetase